MFDTRATTLELLDQPDCDLALATASHRFMETVNGRFGGIRTVRQFLTTELAGHQANAPLRVLDIGSGSCDIPLAVSHWAQAHNRSIHFTCLEPAAHAFSLAHNKLILTNNPDIQLLQEDIFTHQPEIPYDCAVASMCFHHFSDAQINSLMQKLRDFVRKSVLINDLQRSIPASLAARLLLAWTGAPTGVRHDALLSIQRGFKVAELSSLLKQLDNVSVSVEPVRWFRVAAIVHFYRSRVLPYR